MLLVGLPQSQNSLIYIMYGGLILYFIYRQIKAWNVKKKITGENRHEFKRSVTKLMIGLSALIVVFGIFQIINKEYISGILMISLVLILAVDMLDKVIITEDGIYGQGKYITWDKVKKFGFDVNTSEFVAVYKDEMADKNFFIKVENSQIDEMNALIRRYKLKK